MYNIIGSYINRLTKDDIANFAHQKGANFSSREVDFTYDFIKKNWQSILNNPNMFDIDRYQNQYSPENFQKLKKVFNEYLQKFSSYIGIQSLD